MKKLPQTALNLFRLELGRIVLLSQMTLFKYSQNPFPKEQDQWRQFNNKAKNIHLELISIYFIPIKKRKAQQRESYLIPSMISNIVQPTMPFRRHLRRIIPAFLSILHPSVPSCKEIHKAQVLSIS